MGTVFATACVTVIVQMGLHHHSATTLDQEDLKTVVQPVILMVSTHASDYNRNAILHLLDLKTITGSLLEGCQIAVVVQ